MTTTRPTFTRKEFLRLAVAAGAITVVAGVPADASGAIEIRGTATYLQRIALPADAVLEVELADVSLADAPADIIASTRIEPAGQVPIAFSLPFDRGAIDASRSYAIQARILTGGRLMFVTDTRNEVAPLAAADPVELLMTMAREEAPAPSITDVTWNVQSIAGAPLVEGTQPTLVIGSDGRGGGHGGCNSYFATTAIEGDNITFSAIGSTFMACAEDVMAQERALFDALSATRSHAVEEGMLVFRNDTGSETARFFVHS